MLGPGSGVKKHFWKGGMTRSTVCFCLPVFTRKTNFKSPLAAGPQGFQRVREQPDKFVGGARPVWWRAADEGEPSGCVNDLNQCWEENAMQSRWGARQGGGWETSNKVTSRPSERSAPPVFRWLGPGCCTRAGCSRTACSLHQTGLSSTAGLFLENTQQGLMQFFFSLFSDFSSLKY